MRIVNLDACWVLLAGKKCLGCDTKMLSSQSALLHSTGVTVGLVWKPKGPWRSRLC